jgi:D-alanyl-D-alanine carboxypeptidase
VSSSEARPRGPHGPTEFCGMWHPDYSHGTKFMHVIEWGAVVGRLGVFMRWDHASRSHRLTILGLLPTLMIIGANWDAHARDSRKNPHARVVRAIHGPDYRPPYADIVVDENTGQVMHASNADGPRHPASLTKIMTLYLLFEQIEEGKLKLDTPLQISSHAAVQPPTKLGLKANETITVEDAIRGLVTKSANDAAAVVSEAIGGSEEEFAKLMTAKARALGMANTTYVNASGLPAEEQITTARDQAILGSAIQTRFPRYYQYFATRSFRYRGVEMRNHNSLLGQVKGVDGIKTGYTEASGYNLMSSVRRDGKHLIAVVLGGTSNATRDARMRQLLEDNIALASARRAAPTTVESAVQDAAHAGAAAPIPSLDTENGARLESVSGTNAAPLQSAKPQAQPTKSIALDKPPQRRARRATLSKAAALARRKAAVMPTAIH